MGLIVEKASTRQTLIHYIAFLIPAFSCLAYFILPNPILLLMIAGIWAALGLPIVNIGALYLVNKLDEKLQPSNLTKIILTITLVFQLGIAGLLIFSQMS